MKFITTSWDDGSPADIRLAGLLVKYNLQATFYIPKHNVEHEVMTEKHMVELSRHFEIGGHTLTHKSLKKANTEEIRYEVRGSFEWLNRMIGQEPVSFCLPFGHYNRECLDIIHESGFKFIRTTELLSPDYSSSLSHTTLQMFEHPSTTYLKHLLKRRRLKNLGLWIKGGCIDDLFKLLDYYLSYIDLHGGCLHLWGHSWEIEEFDLWHKLEMIFKHISNQHGFSYAKNMDLIVPEPQI